MSRITSVADLVRVHGATRPDDLALTASGISRTFAQLDARSSQVAQALAAEHIGRNDRVAFLDKNSAEFFDTLFGAAKVGAVTVPVSWRLSAREIAAILNDADARMLIVGQEFADVIASIEDDLPGLRRIIVVGDHRRYQPHEHWLQSQPPVDPGTGAGPGDVALQLYTSGTTGQPKGVMLSQHNLLSLMKPGGPVLRLGDQSVNLVAMPLFHIAGIGYALVGMYTGCHTVLLREVDPLEMLRLIGEHRVSNFFAVPAVLQLILGVPDIGSRDFSALRCVVYGASPISEQVLSRALTTFGCEFIQVYGLTETTGTVALLPPDDHAPDSPKAHRLRSTGRAAPGAELRVVVPGTDEDAHPGEVGEIWVRSPQNMVGYWNRPQATADVITPEGWLRSGDAGYFDADGYLYLHDRMKDMIISGGENVYPAEVENVLMSHPDVADVGVIGVPSERWGETVKAIVVKAPAAEATPAELIEFARTNLAHYKCPTSVDFVDELPRNPSGKILKRVLREPYWDRAERAIN
jgi:long-chain acyl-CoA synthetase